MTTRRASEDSVFRQERYMSSPEMRRGLLANCVAARVQVLSAPLHRKLVWWLQKESWRAGGLEQIANEMIQRWPERFTTPTLQRLGVNAGQIYSPAEVKEARKSLLGTPEGVGVFRFHRSFPLRGEVQEDIFAGFLTLQAEDLRKGSRHRNTRAEELKRARSHPSNYPASAFSDYCLGEARSELAKFLFERLCLDPAVELNEQTLWYFPSLIDSLEELHSIRAGAACNRAPVTEIGAKVSDALEYAQAVRGLVLIEGNARIGKTFSVKAWCDAHPGETRYVQVPSSNDDMTFFRAIGEAIGIGTSHAYKALELRNRVEAVLQTGDLVLVLDEGHYLWPQRNLRKSMPARINWLLTQLVNMGVPVVIVTTPQFTKSQENLVRNTGWSSEQLIGRIKHYEKLPVELSEADLHAVARHWMPAADPKTHRVLITYAQSSEKYLQAIESLSDRARFLARKGKRVDPTLDDVLSALKEGVIPSDQALASALSAARNPGRRKPARMPVVQAVQAPCTPPARGMQPYPQSTFTTPERDTGEAVLST